ncbi:MAG: HEAT repeat domain-containing protein [Candidatus Freyarchaeota archaeon]
MNWRVRETAIYAIGNIFKGTNSREVLKALKPLVEDKFEEVRGAVADSLGWVFEGSGDREALELIGKIAERVMKGDYDDAYIITDLIRAADQIKNKSKP